MTAIIDGSGSLHWQVDKLILRRLLLKWDGRPDLTTLGAVTTIMIVTGSFGRCVVDLGR